MRIQPILFTLILIDLLLVAPAASFAQNDANRTYLPVVVSYATQFSDPASMIRWLLLVGAWSTKP